MKRILLTAVFLSASCSKSDTPVEAFLRDGQDGKDGVNATLLCINDQTPPLNDCTTEFIDGVAYLSCLGQETVAIPICGGDKDPNLDPSLLDPAQNQGLKGDKGDKGDQGEPGRDGTAFSLYIDENDCLWMVFPNGDKIKLRGPL